jgi:HlyD family secretion protein
MISHDRGDNKNAGRARSRARPYGIVGMAVLVAALGLALLWIKGVQGGQVPVTGPETFAVRRGPLAIRVLEAGALKAKDPEIIHSSVRRRATIVFIVPEGVRVRKGDLLVELDVSDIVDHCVDHRIWVTNAEAAWVNAREALAITKSLAQSNVEAAELACTFARLDLEKYRGDGGELANNAAKAQGDIALSEQEFKKNQDYYDWSKKLNQARYLADTQLQTDELAMKKSQYNLTLAQNNLKLLENYNSKRQLAQLVSDVNQTAAALERAKAKARATVVQAEALLAAREQEYHHQQEMLAKHEEEIRGSKAYAPVDGMVIYATSVRGGFRDDRQPLADGVDVWERQELIYLQKSTSIVAEVDLHEASLQKVQVGMPAVVTVDALPGRKFMGAVTHVAPLADAQSMWMNPDLKVYRTEIGLDVNDPQLRCGMTCRAEIVVDRQADTLYVPVQAVRRVGGQPTVYVLQEDGRTEARPIEIGLDDNTVVRVVRGLRENELVLLTPPGRAEAAGLESRLAWIRGMDVNEMMPQIRARLKAADGLASAVRHQPSSGLGQERAQ